jgi:hypothetical protein
MAKRPAVRGLPRTSATTEPGNAAHQRSVLIVSAIAAILEAAAFMARRGCAEFMLLSINMFSQNDRESTVAV